MEIMPTHFFSLHSQVTVYSLHEQQTTSTTGAVLFSHTATVTSSTLFTVSRILCGPVRHDANRVRQPVTAGECVTANISPRRWFLISRRFTPLIELLNRIPPVPNIFRHVTGRIWTEGLSHAHSSVFTSA